MTKTELRRAKFKAVLNLLIKEFNAYNIEDADGGRIDFFVYDSDFTFQGQFSRRDFDVALYDTTPLSGPGFSDEEIKKQKAAVAFEDKMNSSIQKVLATFKA